MLSLARLRALAFTETAVRLVQEFGVQDEQALNVFSRGHFKELPRNESATAVYRNNALTHDPANNPVPDDMPWIAGDAVIFAPRVWE